MAIEGIKNVQVANYQAPQAKPIETVSIEAPQQTPEVTKVNTEDTAKNTDSQRREISNEQIKKTIADMNKKMQNTACQYGIHEGTGRVTIKIVDKETKDVIKEFPAEETLELIAKAWELAGIMVDEKL